MTPPVFALTPEQAQELLIVCYVDGIMPLPSPPETPAQCQAMGVLRQTGKTQLRAALAAPEGSRAFPLDLDFPSWFSRVS